MPRLFNVLIHLFAAISIYIILVVGLGWLWRIGTSMDYDRINSVLISLSYSFLTGYLVFLFTVHFPSKRRSKKIGIIVANKLSSIVEHRVQPCLRVFVPPQRYNEAFSDQELINQYEQGDLHRSTFYTSLNHYNSVIEYLCGIKETILHDIDGIINVYSQDMSEDLLNWFEELKKDNVFNLCIAYTTLINLRVANHIQNENTTPDENKELAKGLILFRDSILDKISIIQKESKRKQMKQSIFKSSVSINDEEVDSAYFEQNKAKWTFFNERLHMETVFSQRVNFVLLLFPVLVTAFCAVKGHTERLIISIAGVITLLAFYIPLKRTFFKLDIIQQITYKIKIGDSVEKNPIKFVDNCFRQISAFKRFPDISSYSIIMWGIALMILVMLVLLFLVFFHAL